jgi:hypothetical protein
MGSSNRTADFRCVYCGSKRVRRSRRRGFVERVFLRFFRLRPFHCIDCYKRFYSRPQPIDVQEQEPTLIADSPNELRDQPSLEPKIPMNFRQVERRVFSRLSCQIPARIVVGPGSFIAGVVSGISLNGCFIETPDTVPIGSEIELSLELKEETRSRALIRTSLPTAGLGVEFTLMTTPNFRRLQSILKNSVRLDSNF